MSEMPSVPLMEQTSEGPLQRVNEFLDKYVLPYPVKYLTNRVTILATLGLLLPLIVFANVTVFVLAANSYLNVMSVVVSSTVLLYSTLSEARDRAAAARREEIAKRHQAEVEQRAQQDHELIEEIHQHLDEVRSQLKLEVEESLKRIQSLLMDRITTFQDMHQANTQNVIASNEIQNTEIAAIRQIVDELYKRSSDEQQ
ncbi:MAG: hypothetical protein U0528_01735 [Anaerolineae bacterium]|nr:hypothetical protein [Anaerolineae bacterium]